jgi:hypothetical protein
MNRRTNDLSTRAAGQGRSNWTGCVWDQARLPSRQTAGRRDAIRSGKRRIDGLARKTADCKVPATVLPGPPAPVSRMPALSSSPVAPLSALPPPCHPGADDPLPDPAPYRRGCQVLARAPLSTSPGAREAGALRTVRPVLPGLVLPAVRPACAACPAPPSCAWYCGGFPGPWPPARSACPSLGPARPLLP